MLRTNHWDRVGGEDGAVEDDAVAGVVGRV